MKTKNSFRLNFPAFQQKSNIESWPCDFDKKKNHKKSAFKRFAISISRHTKKRLVSVD